MLMRSDPFRELDRLTQSLTGAGAPSVAPMDAYRQGDEFVVNIDLPGFDPSAVEVTAEQNVLTVSAERRWQPGENAEVIAWERPQGKFSRQLFLGESLDTDHVAASYEHGVLTLKIPVSEQAKPRRIEISGQGDRQAIEASAGDGQQPVGASTS